nr:hypothetical protein [Tanacetum cinerariifolium]
MMKGSNIGIQEKKAKLFNEWERFTSNDGESIESYYHRFLKLMNDLKRNKHFSEKIASNLKFLNKLQPEWSRHVTIVHQKKDLHTADYTQLYDFLKYNQKEVDELKAERLAKTQDPLALMASSNNPCTFLELGCSNAIQNLRVQNVGNHNGLIGVPCNANQNLNGNGNLVAARAEENVAGHNGNQIRCYNYRGEEAEIQLQAKKFDLMAAVADLDEIEEVNANCILMANLQQTSTSGTQTDKALVYDSDGSAKVHNYEVFYDNEIFNMFTQEEQYTELLRPILESHQVPHNDNNVILEVTSVEQSGGTVEQHYANVEETHALYDSLYHNLAIEVEKVNTVSDQKDTKRGTSANTKFAKQSILGKPPKVGEIHALSKTVTSNSIPTPQKSKVVKNDKVIAPRMFRINPFKPFREDKHMPNNVKPSVRTKLITVSQPFVITKKDVNFDSNGLSSTGVDNTKTRRPQPRSNTKNDRVPSASKSSQSKNKEVEVEEHHRKLLLYKNKKHMSSKCNNVKLVTQNGYSKVVCAMCKQCLISINHDVCLLNYVNDMNSPGKKQTANVSIKEKQKKQKSKVKKPKKVGSIERLATPKPSKPKSFLRWSPTGILFDLKVTSNSIPTPQESKVMKNDKVIAPRMFRINPFKPSREDKHMPNNVKTSVRTKLITVSQPPVITKKDVNFDSNGLSST